MLERIQFIKVNKNKRYAYQPRYYDQRKERLNILIDKYKQEEDEDTSSALYRAKMKQRMEQSWDWNSAQSSGARSANFRLIIILMALLLVSYFILDYIEIFSADVTFIED